MTESEWLASNDPQRMLNYLTAITGSVCGHGVECDRKPSDRKLRLFVAAGMRIVLPESEIIGRVEAMADDSTIKHDRLWWPTDANVEDACNCVVTASNRVEAKRQLTIILRCIVGNPFCRIGLPYQFDRCVWCKGTGRQPDPPDECRWCYGMGNKCVGCPWLTPTVLSLAKAIYDDRDFALMPILGDALEEAGCVQEEILQHCRSTGPHARGCWVVDLILGRS